MKKILILAVVVLQSLCVLAQKQDMSILDCYYRLTFQKDTIDNITAEDIMVLRLNRTKSIFFSESAYQLDSLMLSGQGNSIRMDILANGSAKYDKGIVKYNVVKDYGNKTITFADNVGGDHVVYQEQFPQFNWKLEDEKKKIGDHLCRKATCDFRGRTYEAWFTTEIPLQNGPWKFNGLPGLIIEVYDTEKEYHFKFLYMERNKANISLLPRDYTKTTREKYLKTLRNYIKDPVGYIAASSGMKIALSAKAKAKMKAKGIRYNPMELY